MIIPDLLLDRDDKTIDENYLAIIHSLKKEEAAMMKLIQSEADKIIKFVGEPLDFTLHPSEGEILSFIRSTKKVNDLILFKEWLYTQKKEYVELLHEKLDKIDRKEK